MIIHKAREPFECIACNRPCTQGTRYINVEYYKCCMYCASERIRGLAVKTSLRLDGYNKARDEIDDNLDKWKEEVLVKKI